MTPAKKKRGPKPSGNAREDRLEVRLTALEARLIADAAALDARTVSGWARKILIDAARAALTG